MPAILSAWDTARSTNTPTAATAPCLTWRESGSLTISEKQTPPTCPTSTCSAADFLARASALPEAAADSTTQGAPCSLSLPDWLKPGTLSTGWLKMFLLDHDGGRTFAAILREMEKLGYFVEWQVLNSADFGVPQARKRVYLIGYLDERCRGKIFPFTEGAGAPAVQPRPAEAAAQIKCATKKGYQTARVGDSIDLSYATSNTRRGRVGHGIAHTLTACGKQGTLCFVDLNADPKLTENARCLTTRQDNGIHRHKGEVSGVLQGGRIRRLTPRECLRLQGWADDRIDKILVVSSERQAYRQAGNGVTVNVVEAIGKRLAAIDAELCGG